MPVATACRHVNTGINEYNVAIYLIYVAKAKPLLHPPGDRVEIIWRLLCFNSALNVSSRHKKSQTDINEKCIDQQVTSTLVYLAIAQKTQPLDGAVTVAVALGD